MPVGHRTAELRSIAMHRCVADRLDDAVLAAARCRVEKWRAAGGPVAPDVASRWHALLARPLPELKRALIADTQMMRDLRQDTPFAGVVPARDRWAIIREVG